MPLWRGIAARNAKADYFGGIADFGEWKAVMEIAGRWDPLQPGPAGSLAALPHAQWVTGPGSIYIMAPFVFCKPGRFGDGSYGVLYAALDEATALAETASSRARFLRQGGIGREILDHLMLRLQATGAMEDLRPLFGTGDPIYHPDDWSAAQARGAALRAAGAQGLVYASVRRVGGECLAGFRPDLFSRCLPAGFFQLFWDGERMQGPDGRLFS